MKLEEQEKNRRVAIAKDIDESLDKHVYRSKEHCIDVILEYRKRIGVPIENVRILAEFLKTAPLRVILGIYNETLNGRKPKEKEEVSDEQIEISEYINSKEYEKQMLEREKQDLINDYLNEQVDISSKVDDYRYKGNYPLNDGQLYGKFLEMAENGQWDKIPPEIREILSDSENKRGTR